MSAGMDALPGLLTEARNAVTEIEPFVKQAIEKVEAAHFKLEAMRFSGNPERINPLIQRGQNLKVKMSSVLTDVYQLYQHIEAVKRGQSI